MFGCPKFTLIAFLAILEEYVTYYFGNFDKMAAGAHFGYPKFTFDRISGYFRSIRNLFFFGIFLQNGYRRPFWMSEIHFRSPVDILDVRKSVLIAFLAISDRSAILKRPTH